MRMLQLFVSICLLASTSFAEFKTTANKVILPLSSRVKADELSVLWWNTECAAEARAGQRAFVQSNLKELSARENKIDVVLLGEFCAANIAPETLEALSKQYPYFKHINYNNDSLGFGFGVYSAHPIAFSETKILDWVPASEPLASQNIYRSFWQNNNTNTVNFKRAYTNLKIIKNNKSYNLVPVHLAHPWESYLKVFFKNSHKLASLAIAHELLTGTRNPLMCQLENLFTQIKNDFQNPDDYRLMLIGDFNFPTDIARVPTAGYRLIKNNGFVNGMTSRQPTQRYRNLKIDQAFISEGSALSDSEVLPLEGSDHYPIFVRLK